MNSKVIIQGAILCAMLLIGFVESQDGSGSRTSRRRRCRCKKYITQLNVDINKRLQAFEDKFEHYFTQSIDDITNKTQNSIYDNIGNSWSAEMNQTRQALKMESFSLRKLQQSIRSQRVTVDTLSENFKDLDAIVRNLSAAVERLDATMRTNADRSSRRHRNRNRNSKQEVTSPVTYPKGEL